MAKKKARSVKKVPKKSVAKSMKKSVKKPVPKKRKGGRSPSGKKKTSKVRKLLKWLKLGG